MKPNRGAGTSRGSGKPREDGASHAVLPARPLTLRATGLCSRTPCAFPGWEAYCTRATAPMVPPEARPGQWAIGRNLPTPKMPFPGRRHIDATTSAAPGWAGSRTTWWRILERHEQASTCPFATYWDSSWNACSMKTRKTTRTMGTARGWSSPRARRLRRRRSGRPRASQPPSPFGTKVSCPFTSSRGCFQPK